MINYTYGVLANGFTTTDKPEFGRYSTARRNEKQEGYLSELFSADIPTEALCCNVELLIGLLRCSESWPTYSREWDRDNTYNNQLVMPVGRRGLITYAQLLDWCEGLAITSDKYPVRAYDNGPDKICNTLFNILTLK